MESSLFYGKYPPLELLDQFDKTMMHCALSCGDKVWPNIINGAEMQSVMIVHGDQVVGVAAFQAGTKCPVSGYEGAVCVIHALCGRSREIKAELFREIVQEHQFTSVTVHGIGWENRLPSWCVSGERLVTDSDLDKPAEFHAIEWYSKAWNVKVQHFDARLRPELKRCDRYVFFALSAQA